MVSEEEEWSIVQGALQILTVADCLTSRASVFEASLHATLARIGTSLSLSVLGTNILEKSSVNETGELSLMSKNGALDVAALHLSDMPEKAKKLLTLLEQVHEFANSLRIV
jgi:conserved oligomeric Golgi complex subunit 7